MSNKPSYLSVFFCGWCQNVNGVCQSWCIQGAFKRCGNGNVSKCLARRHRWSELVFPAVNRLFLNELCFLEPTTDKIMRNRLRRNNTFKQSA